MRTVLLPSKASILFDDHENGYWTCFLWGNDNTIDTIAEGYAKSEETAFIAMYCHLADSAVRVSGRDYGLLDDILEKYFDMIRMRVATRSGPHEGMPGKGL